MDNEVLLEILKRLMFDANNFDIRTVRLDNERYVDNKYNYFPIDVANSTIVNILSRIKEEVQSGKIDESFVGNIININQNSFMEEHSFSNLDMDYNARIYLNPTLSDEYFKFIEEFIIKGLENKIRFEFKPSNSFGDSKYKDGMIIYTTEEYLEKAIVICDAIFENNNELGDAFGVPPYGTICPNKYFGFCQNNKFNKRMETYNDYFNVIAKQSFVHLILEDNPELIDDIGMSCDIDMINKFMNYNPTFRMNFGTDIVTSTFMSNSKLIKKIWEIYADIDLTQLTTRFYTNIMRFHSMMTYKDLDHQIHPALTENISYLGQYNKKQDNSYFYPAGDLDSNTK